jgi:nitric oxide reductase subunit B
MERILGVGYLDSQLKLQVHFQMLLATASIFSLGVMLFLWDFFILNPRRGTLLDTRDAAPREVEPVG